VVSLSGVELFKVHTSDDVLPISNEVAYKKAITALAFKKSTYALMHEPDPINILPEKYCMWYGGILIPCIDGRITENVLFSGNNFFNFAREYDFEHVGAIGVSGFDAQTDEEVAIRGLWYWFTELKKEGFLKN
jgi:uncharacterized protein GlcG (DUF336 family)